MIPKFPKSAPKSKNASPVAGHVYDPASQHLDVHFTSGRIYRYENVSPEKAADFRRASSKGSFAHSHLAPHHPAHRIK